MTLPMVAVARRNKMRAKMTLSIPIFWMKIKMKTVDSNPGIFQRYKRFFEILVTFELVAGLKTVSGIEIRIVRA